MPCYLFTFHAYGTWMPDRRQGFVRRGGQGVLPPDGVLAESYRERAAETQAIFDATVQRLLIEETCIACEKQRYRGHSIATDSTHLHALVSWLDQRPWLKIRTSLKSSLSRRLNREVKRRHNWFVDSASRKRVKDQQHFDYLANVYLPSHRGWKWRERGEPYL